MKITAIQNQSISGAQAKMTFCSCCGPKKIVQDSFTKEKADDVSFEGIGTALKGGGLGAVVGGAAGTATSFLADGAFNPTILAFFVGITSIAGIISAYQNGFGISNKHKQA